MKCCLCGAEIHGWGHNPWPLNKKDDDRCCNACNDVYVIPARLAQMYEKGKEKDGKRK